jgi:predicted small metal-binding protein
MIKEIVCDCGWTARGTEDELVAAAQAHGRDAHGLAPTREQVLAVATPAPDDDTDVED